MPLNRRLLRPSTVRAQASSPGSALARRLRRGHHRASLNSLILNDLYRQMASPPGTARMRAVGWEPDGNTFWNHSAQEAPNWARVHACAPSILTIIAADAKRPRASIESALAHGLCAQSTS